VLVTTSAGILSDIVRTYVAAEPDFELIAPDGPSPHVVILNDGEEGPTAATEMLETHPRSKVIVISHDARMAELFELTPTRRPLGELSHDSLVSAVRAAATRR
jgi:hypothetical protein